MSDLRLYNSEGERVDSDTGEYSDRIADFFFGGVRLYIERKSRSTIELIVFFRARESEASRAEQYYAVYEADDRKNIFDQFTTELKTKIEDEQGMLLQTTSEDVAVFNSLTRGQSAPGTLTEHDNIDSLLREGRQLKFSVSSSTAAVGLVEKYLDDPCQRLAIADDISINELDECDLLVETGGDEEFTPIGSTEELLAEKERANSIHSELEGSDGPTTKKEEILNKVTEIGRLVGVFVLIFILLLITLIVIASVTNIGVIAVFDITNILDTITGAADPAATNVPNGTEMNGTTNGTEMNGSDGNTS